MSEKETKIPLERVDDYTWKIPESYESGMRVPVIVFADKVLLEKIKGDRTLRQCCNIRIRTLFQISIQVSR